MSKEKRFEKVYSQTMGTIEIWIDTETGVNYLYRQNGYAGGLTTLLDKDGKPVVTPVTKKIQGRLIYGEGQRARPSGRAFALGVASQIKKTT